MRLYYSLPFLLLFCTVTGAAQPVWSPAVRAERETTWMRDSLQLSAPKLNKVNEICLVYNRSKDSVKQAGGKNKDKNIEKLERKKDADIKALLDKDQYRRYYRRELMVRKQEKVVYKGHQPY